MIKEKKGLLPEKNDVFYCYNSECNMVDTVRVLEEPVVKVFICEVGRSEEDFYIPLSKIYKNKEDVNTLCKLMRYKEINNQIQKAEENIQELLMERAKIMETIS